jgi:hypothetical protein
VLKYIYTSKIGAIIIMVILCCDSKALWAQYQYSIDIEVKRSRRVPIKFVVLKTVASVNATVEHRKKKRGELKLSKKIRKHTYRIQSRKVKKRMRKSRKKAEDNNREKVPIGVKLKNCLNG